MPGTAHNPTGPNVQPFGQTATRGPARLVVLHQVGICISTWASYAAASSDGRGVGILGRYGQAAIGRRTGRDERADGQGRTLQ